MGALSMYTVHLAFVIACMLSLVNCQTPSLNAGGLYFVDNQTRTMLCYVSSTEDLSPSPLTWEKGGQLMTGRGEGKTSPSPGFYTYRSYLDLPVQASDNGKSITCKYKNQSPGSSWTIYVKKPPDHPTLTGEVNVTWGQTYNWTCTVGGATRLSESDVSLTFSNASTNSSSISSKSSSAMGAYNITTYTVTKVLTLTIPTNSSDFTVFCNVTHELLTSSLEAILTLTVLYSPVVTVNSVSYTAAIRNTTTLACLVMAHPSVTSVTWYKDGSLLNRTSGRFQNGDAGHPSLTVANIQREDGGQYTCGASNSLGSTNGSAILLTVVSAPVVTLSYTKNETDTLVITCSYDANPAPFDVTWTRNCQSVDVAGSGGKYSGATVATPSLTVTRLVRSDAGVYVCSVTNNIDTGHSPDVIVSVNYSPVVNTPVTYYNGSRGGSVTLKCEVTANPAPTGISWFKDGSPVVTSGPGSKYTGGTTSTPDLTVNTLSDSDTGSYFCSAINSLGSTNGTDIRLEVTYAPLITSSSAPLTGTELSPLTLPCTYDANPSPSHVLWDKNSSNITLPSSHYFGGTPSSPSLTILSLTPEDTGSYACTVVNSLGNASTGAIVVTAQYAPKVDSGPGGQKTIQTGQTVTLACNVSAVPAVTSVT